MSNYFNSEQNAISAAELLAAVEAYTKGIKCKNRKNKKILDKIGIYALQ